VAYAWSGEDGKNFDIYVKLIDAGHPLRLTNGPEEDAWPAWPPDGKHVAFTRIKGKTLQFLMVPALGGVERLIAEQPWLRQEQIGRPGFAWRPDGKHIVYSALSDSGQTGFVLVDLESGARTRLTAPPQGTFAELCPHFFADGSKLAFFRYRNTTTGSVELLTLKDKSVRSYPVALDFVLALAIAPGGQEVFLTTSGPLQRLRLDTGVLSPAPPLLRSVAHPSFSSDGHRLVFQQRTGDANIWHTTLDGPGRAGTPTQWDRLHLRRQRPTLFRQRGSDRVCLQPLRGVHAVDQ
jgi:Tol biopolymer transport system component